MKFSSTFSELNKNDANIAGGKGASLGEMTQADIPVPPGFVILSTTFDHFLKETDLAQEIDAIIKTVDHKAIHTVDNASEKIRGLIESREVPEDIAEEIQSEFKKLRAEFVAVRSSATAEDGAEHAWAGQLESFLNTNKNTLLENVRRCWSSLFTPRAIFYRFEKGLHGTDISVAVVVQKMVQSEVSGIAFSVHPVTEDRNQLIIEAGFGLGEAIVSGSITPDSYVVEKTTRKIIDINVADQKRGLFRNENRNEWKKIESSEGNKQKLFYTQIEELSNIILNIENHYGFPCDIEWAYEGGKFYIVQSRPITTLSKENSEIKTNNVILSRIYSREKSLFHFTMWNDSDRIGYKDFLNYDVKNNLFITLPHGQKGSVWYSFDELNRIDSLVKEEIKNNADKFIDSIMDRLNHTSKEIFPYLLDEKEISSIEDFKHYYKNLVEWWSALNTVFTVPDMQEVPENIRNKILDYRIRSEKYTEKINRVMVECFKIFNPQHLEISQFVQPIELVNITEGKISKDDLDLIYRRIHGCFMLDGEVFPLSDLEKTLKEKGILLEKITPEGVKEIKGSIAYKGNVRGKVKKILGFKDMSDFKEGDILVTEMTNPDYLPIVRIAAAVITDEGGATCHAAIACRELKIPCIVGTKVVTQMLEDGDEVEVDADNGIIRII